MPNTRPTSGWLASPTRKPVSRSGGARRLGYRPRHPLSELRPNAAHADCVIGNGRHDPRKYRLLGPGLILLGVRFIAGTSRRAHCAMEDTEQAASFGCQETLLGKVALKSHAAHVPRAARPPLHRWYVFAPCNLRPRSLYRCSVAARSLEQGTSPS